MMRSTAAQLLCFLSTINVVLARELASRNKTVLLGLTKTQLMIGVPVTIGVVGLIAFGIWHFFFKATKCEKNQYVLSGKCTPCAAGSTRDAGDDASKEDTKCTVVVNCINTDGETENSSLPCACSDTNNTKTICNKTSGFCHPDGQCTKTAKVNCPGSALDTECKNSSEENVDCPEGSVCIAANNSAGVCADKNVCATAKS